MTFDRSAELTSLINALVDLRKDSDQQGSLNKEEKKKHDSLSIRAQSL